MAPREAWERPRRWTRAQRAQPMSGLAIRLELHVHVVGSAAPPSQLGASGVTRLPPDQHEKLVEKPAISGIAPAGLPAPGSMRGM